MSCECEVWSYLIITLTPTEVFQRDVIDFKYTHLENGNRNEEHSILWTKGR